MRAPGLEPAQTLEAVLGNSAWAGDLAWDVGSGSWVHAWARIAESMPRNGATVEGKSRFQHGHENPGKEQQST